MGAAFDSCTSLSTSSTVRSSSSVIRHISDADEFRMRLTTKPGASRHRIGVLRSRCANSEADWTVSADVC